MNEKAGNSCAEVGCASPARHLNQISCRPGAIRFSTMMSMKRKHELEEIIPVLRSKSKVDVEEQQKVQGSFFVSFAQISLTSTQAATVDLLMNAQKKAQPHAATSTDAMSHLKDRRLECSVCVKLHQQGLKQCQDCSHLACRTCMSICNDCEQPFCVVCLATQWERPLQPLCCRNCA